MQKFLADIKRRKVFRTSVMYMVVAWLLIQVGATTFEPIGMPEGSLRILIIAALAGFPFAVALGWVFDWTEHGIVRTPAEHAKASAKGKKRGANFPLIVGSIASVLVMLLSYGGYRGYDFYAKVQWAQNEAQPELTKLVENSDFFAAFALAKEVEQALGKTPALEPVWKLISAPVSFNTEPSGALVSYRPYDDPDAPWVELGTTPIAETLVPRQNALWKIEKPGYVTRFIARAPTTINSSTSGFFSWPADYVLDKQQSTFKNQIAVEGRRYLEAPLAGLNALESFDVQRFYIDKTEVTNQQYQEFVDAGGYEQGEFWLEPFVDDNGNTLSFDQAVERFIDSTGRTGPSTWIAGRFPDGKTDYPVAGVSWYEAAAYARFRGRHLPTIYHWAIAALPDSEIIASLTADLAAQSNLESEQLLPVGSTTGLSAIGAQDMFGNVSEWVWNIRNRNERFSLGLGWSDPAYNASVAGSTSPWSRLSHQGFRLATYPSGEPDAALTKDFNSRQVDLNEVTSVSDEAYEILTSTFAKPLSDVQATETSLTLPNGFVARRAEINYPYSDDKLPVFLLFPEKVKPPYQALVWFGGVNAVFSQDNQSLYEQDMAIADFLRKSGRVIVMPIWQDTFERNNGSSLQKIRSRDYSELVNNWMRDLTYTLDYLETRDDIDSSRLGYVGLSFGSNMSVFFLHNQPRLKTAILMSGGLFYGVDSESDVLLKSAMERTTLPTLMLNGQHDYIIPLDRQRIFFNLLGTPDQDKKHVVFNSGHLDWPIGPFVKENLDWLDKYLGPVERSK